MIDPKSFYREMDALLAAIRIDQTDGNFLEFILLELEKRFGKRLGICNGRLYEQRGDDFILIKTIDPQQKHKFASRLPIAAEAMQLVASSRSYIYDDARFYSFFLAIGSTEKEIPAAVWVHSPEHHWIIVFKLCENWMREEVSLFLNAVRMACNYRLFSDSMSNTIEQAVKIQKSLLPKKPPEYKGYDIAGRSNPAEYVGGDFYDYFDLDEGIFGVSFGDASGHGLPAALLVRDVVIGLRMGLAKELRLVHTIRKLNEVIQRSTYSTNFVSLFVGEIEPDGHLFYANAGHPAPFIVKDKKIKELPATGITLGFMKDIELHRSYAQLPEDSVLVIFSDGIVERENDKHEQFELGRLKKLVQKNKNLSARELVDLVFDTVYEFGNRVAWDDDATLVIIKRLRNTY